MKIGVYPFPSSGNITENLKHIQKAVEEAAAAGVRLLAFHECALCGYPPIENSIEAITPEAIKAALAQVSALAARHHLYIALGTVRFEPGASAPEAAPQNAAASLQRFNSLVLFDDAGNLTGTYDKTALWGWDCDHFVRGSKDGIFTIDGNQIGLRICFDVRFPESFRSLFQADCPLCIIAFSDTAEAPDPERYGIIKSHLITRAAENCMAVASVNSTSRFQTAPTAFFDRDGRTLAELEPGTEGLLVFDFQPQEPDFGTEGRRVNAEFFLNRE
ncbi:MAG: carbon-nitrogen hydrolase family protein [Clostridiales bacterium]|nr:carbon-nitrogen hydrolase family protein [Clostridiales bacterium]